MDSASASFIALDPLGIAFLFIVGFIGGMVSGFIGSGGAFVLTPAMMSMGVPGIVAVASNMCHKFPKALVGASKRAKYGQVDLKLGVILGISAEMGVVVSAFIQEAIKRAFGNAGSNLYVSAAFVVVLVIVGGYVLRDAWRSSREQEQDAEDQPTRIARWVQSLKVPGTMVYLPSIKSEVSVLVTVPIGLATGMLAATIAVGGFIGVPSMMYVLGVPSLMASATELVIAFVMGLGGTLIYGWSGYVDIRLAMIILAGSLFGVQLGAIGTTYVKAYMVKLVMGLIMIIVLLSRALVIPVYLSDLGLIAPLSTPSVTLFKDSSLAVMVLALVVGAVIILRSLVAGIRSHREELAIEAAARAQAAPAATPGQLSPTGRLERVLLATDGSEFSAGATEVAIDLAQGAGADLTAMTTVLIDFASGGIPGDVLKAGRAQARGMLREVKLAARRQGYDAKIELRQGTKPEKEIIRCAEDMHADVIVMGRRGRRGLARMMVGLATRQVIGYSDCNVLVVPRLAGMWHRRILLGIDGSRHSEAAAVVAARLAKLFRLPVSVVSVLMPRHDALRRSEGHQAVERVRDALVREGIDVQAAVLEGDPADVIVQFADKCGADMIVLGSHGRTGLGRVLLGSVCEAVVGRTSLSVMVVKA